MKLLRARPRPRRASHERTRPRIWAPSRCWLRLGILGLEGTSFYKLEWVGDTLISSRTATSTARPRAPSSPQLPASWAYPTELFASTRYSCSVAPDATDGESAPSTALLPPACVSSLLLSSPALSSSPSITRSAPAPWSGLWVITWYGLWLMTST